jgi:hypothetical protein
MLGNRYFLCAVITFGFIGPPTKENKETMAALVKWRELPHII